MRAFIELDQVDHLASVHVSEGQHEHLSNKRSLSTNLKAEIDFLFESGTTNPTKILASLKKTDLTIEKSQLSNYLARLKKKRPILAMLTNIPILKWTRTFH